MSNSLPCTRSTTPAHRFLLTWCVRVYVTMHVWVLMWMCVRACVTAAVWNKSIANVTWPSTLNSSHIMQKCTMHVLYWGLWLDVCFCVCVWLYVKICVAVGEFRKSELILIRVNDFVKVKHEPSFSLAHAYFLSHTRTFFHSLLTCMCGCGCGCGCGCECGCGCVHVFLCMCLCWCACVFVWVCVTAAVWNDSVSNMTLPHPPTHQISLVYTRNAPRVWGGYDE